MRLAAGETLGHYRIEALLGAGGMGEVYRATDVRLGRAIALKILPSDVGADHDSGARLERFQREAKAVAALNHPNIVTLFSVEDVDGVYFLTMELVDGRSLHELIPPEGFPAERVIALGTSIAEAIAAAHATGLVHRDLKPANVMLTGDGRVKVLDFGLAKDLRPAGQDDTTTTSFGRTQIGVVVGTPFYMSPEQISGADIDQRTDVFSLGVILYEMLTGRRPFQGASTAALAASILRDSPPAITKARVPSALVSAIERCLAKGVDDRLQSARLLADTLRDIRLDSAPVSDTRAGYADQRFKVSVSPFTFRGSNSDLETFAEGLTTEINAGLSRFSYLRVVGAGSSDISSWYVLDGSIRQAGRRIRVSVRMRDTRTDAQLWGETYERSWNPDTVFGVQDDLVARIVSTCADPYGILPRSISDVVRGTDPAAWSPYEALVHFFGYHQRLTIDDHLAARTGLEHAVDIAPRNADCWAVLSIVYAHEHGHGFNPLPAPLKRAYAAATRAIDLAPGNHFAHQAMSTVQLFRKEITASLHEADRAVELNPLDGGCNAAMGANIAFAGDWDRGCALIERAMDLNPQHPVWYRGMLSFKEYARGNYSAAIEEALKTNAPYLFWMQVVLAAACGQLGDREAASTAVTALTAQMPDFSARAGAILGTWFQPDLTEHLIQGLQKAGVPLGNDL